MLHKLNLESFSQDSNFVSIHKLNKKRRFANIEINQNNYNSNYIHEKSKSKEINFVKVIENQDSKPSLNDSQVNDFLNSESEVIIKVFTDSNSIIQAREFLNEKLSRYISKFIFII